MTITLRPYQKEAVSDILKAWTDYDSALVSMATGTGKTETFLGVIDRVLAYMPDARVLIICHYQELIRQPYDRIVKNWPQLPTPGIVMGAEDEADAQIVIASIQTLARTEDRLDRLLQHGAFDFVIRDEAHRAVSPSDMGVYERLRAANPAMKLLGVTATPVRADGRGLKEVFKTIAHRITIKDAIVRHKCLSPFMAFSFELPVEIPDEARTRSESGFDDETVGRILSVQNAIEIVIEKWREYAKDRPTIVFTSSVYQAHVMADAFRAAGYDFRAIDGTMKQDERRVLLDGYKSGAIQGLVNCQVLTEGFDAPATSCVVWCKPTNSDSVFIQGVGRGLRLAPGKKDCLILYFTPEKQNSLVMPEDILGKPRKQKQAEEKAAEKGVTLSAFGLNSQGQGIDGDPDQVIVQALDFFMSGSLLAWTFDGRLASSSAGEGLAIAIVLPDTERKEKADALKAAGRWFEAWNAEYAKIGRYHVYKLQKGQGAVKISDFDSWDEATLCAEDFVAENGQGILNERKANWRKLPPTEGQVKYMTTLRVPKIEEIRTRGDAAKAITHAKARQALRHMLA